MDYPLTRELLHSARPLEILFVQNPKTYYAFQNAKRNVKNFWKKTKRFWMVFDSSLPFARIDRLSFSINRQIRHILQRGNLNSSEIKMMSSASYASMMMKGVTIYFSAIFPTDPFRCDVHILLSRRTYYTEIELSGVISLEKSLDRAGFDSDQSIENTVETPMLSCSLHSVSFLEPMVLLSAIQETVEFKVKTFA